MDKENQSQERIPKKYEVMLAIFGTAVVLPIVGFTIFIAPTLGVDLSRTSFFSAYRALLALMLPMLVFPTAIFGEFLNKDWKKRKFLWKSAFLGVGLFGIFTCVTIFLLTLADLLFYEVNIVWQIPLAALCSSSGLIALALVARSAQFKRFAREKAGW